MGRGLRWSAFESVIIVCRQNGKGSILEARQLAGLFLFRERLQIHTAHEFKTAYEHFRRIVDLIEGCHDLERQVKIIRTGAGDQSIELKTGERIRFIARSRSSARGFSGDAVYLDEAFKLETATVGALMPTLSARPNPQLWYTSSAPHLDSPVLHGLRTRGLSGAEPRLFYAEWAASEEDNLADPETWYATNPALGIRITEEFVANELRAMDSAEFARERCGVPEGVNGFVVIPPASWDAVNSPTAAPSGSLTFCADINPERSAGAIAVCGDGGTPTVELLEHRSGTAWMLPMIVEVARSNRARVVVDRSGPAGTLIADLEQARVEVVALDGPKASGAFYDDVVGGALAIRTHYALDDAMRGARKRPVGDSWTWARKDTAADVSPLVAASGALWCATRMKKPRAELFVAVT